MTTTAMTTIKTITTTSATFSESTSQLTTTTIEIATKQQKQMRFKSNPTTTKTIYFVCGQFLAKNGHTWRPPGICLLLSLSVVLFETKNKKR